MNLQVTRINASTISVTWEPLSPRPVGGYEVFYQVDGGDIISAGTTINTMFTGTNLLDSVLQQLSCFVVAIGMNNVPTDRSEVAIFRGKVLCDRYRYSTLSDFSFYFLYSRWLNFCHWVNLTNLGCTCLQCEL